MKGFLALLFCSLVLSSNAQQADSPKLVVGIVVDQMCYEYLYRYFERFDKGGFRLLMDKGTNCRNTNYDYIPTYTGPGHASIYTGTTPSNHGIVSNDWYDRTTNGNVNCVTDSLVVPLGTTSSYGYFSPRNLKSNTITDQLKLTYPTSKVVSMSIKNRGAILPGGHLSDGSYWFDYVTGKFISSSFYYDALPALVDLFNKTDHVGEYLKNDWNTLYPIDTYKASGPDNSPYEHVFTGKTTPTFPYNLSELKNTMNPYNLFVHTPHSNTYLTEFAIAAIEGEGLGQDDQTDMLCISYSTPDILGHSFGPYSVELEDMYLRLDLEVQKLIEVLIDKIGKKEFTLFLTADHAVVPVPQYLMDKKLPGGYFFLNAHKTELSTTLIDKYGADLVEEVDNLNIYLHHDRIDSLKLDLNEVSNFVAQEIQRWEGIKRVFTGDQLYNAAVDDQWMDMVRKGYHHAESGDVIFILEPGFLPKSLDTETARKGTSHGSAYNYDTHVPLLWYGKGIPSQEVLRKLSITDIAATLSHLLYLQNPNSLTGKPILELLSK